jgi:hypothetical protein
MPALVAGGVAGLALARRPLPGAGRVRALARPERAAR